MLHRPRGAIAIALCLIATLMAARAALEPPHIRVQDAALYDGNRVTVTGYLDAVRVYPDGQAVATLRFAGHGLELRGQELPEAGSYVEATGDLRRTAGRLVLWTHDVHAVAPQAGPITLRSLAQAPQANPGPAIVHGHSDGTTLTDGDVSMRLEGIAVPEGSVEVTASPAYRPWCACWRLVVHEARPWTPS